MVTAVLRILRLRWWLMGLTIDDLDELRGRCNHRPECPCWRIDGPDHPWHRPTVRPSPHAPRWSDR